ncbi:outer membrane protein assembly factor BamD [Saccharicrinis fermentans]|uniref:DNA uptake lipoprotein n=1 Tax=Saccharicrinis fermentans DSM 9555 = JCM 21142 TaxID=869213 RepID=W7Y3U3_9BACT|nr:hypothetical protein [Saccharicrinis fermentans]GAF05535.1 DNA uptake lipoprotein [Saccharicrinis fermentans DSM 9555 = JCM 21142]
MKKITLVIFLLTNLYLFNSCKEVISNNNNPNNTPVESKELIKNKLCSPKELITKAQEYYDNKEYSKSLAMLAELEERYPDSEECKKGITIEGLSSTSNIQTEKAINATMNKIEGETKNREKSKSSYNHVLAIEISSNNLNEKVIEDRKCQTNIWFEGSNIVVSGYLAEKSYYKILSTGTFMDSKYYEVKTDLQESTFLFDDKSNSVVWQRIKHDNSGVHVYFENK